MFVDEEVATRVEIDGNTITEEEIETRPEKLPGILVNSKEKLQAIYKYMDSDAVTTLHATIKAKEDDIPGAWVCPECAEITADGHEVVEYESCYEWYHTACLASTENFKASWSCCKCNPTCMKSLLKIFNFIRNLNLYVLFTDLF